MAPSFMNNLGDRNGLLADRSAAISGTNSAPENTSITEIQTDGSIGETAMKMVSKAKCYLPLYQCCVPGAPLIRPSRLGVTQPP